MNFGSTYSAILDCKPFLLDNQCFLNDFFWAPVLFCVCVFFFKSVIFNLSPKIHKNISSNYFISCLKNTVTCYKGSYMFTLSLFILLIVDWKWSLWPGSVLQTAFLGSTVLDFSANWEDQGYCIVLSVTHQIECSAKASSYVIHLVWEFRTEPDII